jgi:type III secretion protein T
MPEQVILRFLDEPAQSLILFAFIATLRPLGLLFGFVAFAWGIGQGRLIRGAIGLSLGFPMAVAGVDQILAMIARKSPVELAMILPKEFIIGFALGFLASLPFIALKAAGAITDTFRGESDSGHTDPSGGTMPTWGMVFVLLGFFAFFGSGGLWQLIAMLYQSYAVWPLTAPLPPMSALNAPLIVQFISPTLALLVAAPLLTLLVAVEFILIVAARVAQRFQIYGNEFAVKNLTAILALPLMVFYVARVVDDHLTDSLDALPILQQLFP